MLSHDNDGQSIFSDDLDGRRLLNLAGVVKLYQAMAAAITRITGSDMADFKEAEKIASSLWIERDLILCVLWQTGMFTNGKIADVFEISASMVSHAVHGFRKKMRHDRELKRKTGLVITQIDV